MLRKKVTLNRELALHARPAAAFVKIARRFDATITLEKNGERVDGKSIMGVMMLAVAHGETVYLETAGPDEKSAGDELQRFLEHAFYER
jgi:phosphocarrier protein HPr